VRMFGLNPKCRICGSPDVKYKAKQLCQRCYSREYYRNRTSPELREHNRKKYTEWRKNNRDRYRYLQARSLIGFLTPEDVVKMLEEKNMLEAIKGLLGMSVFEEATKNPRGRKPIYNDEIHRKRREYNRRYYAKKKNTN